MNATRVTWCVAMIVCIAGVAGAQTEWVDDPNNPVIGPGDPGDWDGGTRNPLAVVEVDGTYHLFFNGQAEGSPEFLEYDIGHATSSDGVEWTMDPANPVLTRGAPGEWDDASLWGAAVIHDGSMFHLWYCGARGDIKRGGYATSPDGSAWTKHPNNPVIDVGPPGSFDEKEVKPGAVIVSDGIYRMWYSGSTDWAGTPPAYDWKIGYAESDDGLNWIKHPGNPVVGPRGDWESRYVFAPSVLFDGDTYHLWYAGGSPSGHAIGYAESADGVEWFRCVDNPVVTAQSGVGYEFPNVLVGDTGEYEMWYHDWSQDSIRRATSDCCEALNFRHFIPAAALASGAEGAFYQTDVDLNNPGDQPTEYEFLWLPRGETNTEPMTSEPFSLGGGMSVRYTNVLSEVFGLEPNALGALMVRSSSPDLLAMSRTYNIPGDGSAGTFGQAIPAIPPSDFIQTGERRRILFASEHEDLRFNVGCQSSGDGTMVVNLELFDHEGSSLGTEMMILRAWGNDQMNRIFQDYMPVNGYVDVWTAQSGRSFTCYGSVLDNVTSDPTTVLPQ